MCGTLKKFYMFRQSAEWEVGTNGILWRKKPHVVWSSHASGVVRAMRWSSKINYFTD